MNQSTSKSCFAMRLASIASMCLVISAAQAQAPSAMPHAASTPEGVMQQGNMASTDLKQTMMMGMEGMQKMPMSGDTDKDFVMMMKMHHQQALNMAEMELKHGKSPEVKAMAKRIIAAQKKEIAQFDRWLAKHP
jgi:uncharacterized protein (DUF305 family)